MCIYIYTYLYSCGYPYAKAINPWDKGWTISHANYIQHVYQQDGRHLTGLKSGPCAPCQHAHHSKSCAKSIGSGPCCKGISTWTNMETPDVFQWKFSSSSCLKNEETWGDARKDLISSRETKWWENLLQMMKLSFAYFIPRCRKSLLSRIHQTNLHLNTLGLEGKIWGYNMSMIWNMCGFWINRDKPFQSPSKSWLTTPFKFVSTLVTHVCPC